MKKITRPKHIEERIARRRLEAHLRHKDWERHRNRSVKGLSRSQVEKRDRRAGYKALTAPQNFSINDNTEEVVKYIADIEKCYDRNQETYVVLEDVVNIDYGAILALLSIMIEFRSKGINFNGDLPNNVGVRNKLTESGFFPNLYKDKTPDLDEKYCITNSSNHAETHAWKKVDSELSAEIIKEATKTIWGIEARCQGVQRCLLELMQNTNNHAEIGKSGTKNWWLFVNHDHSNKVVSFAFVDFGVGIFENLNNKPNTSKFYGWLSKVKKRLLYGDNADLLRLIMSGEFHQTVTGKYYRGKGLPGIAEALQRNQLSNLKIVTNNAFGDIGKSIYKLFDSKFNGTYVYWELNEANEHCR